MRFTLTVQQGDMPPLTKRINLGSPGLWCYGAPPWLAGIVRAAQQREQERVRWLQLAELIGHWVGIPEGLTLAEAEGLLPA